MSQSGSEPYPPALPHDPLEEVFPDVFMVRGSYQASRLVRFGRNMVVLRNGNSLAVINSVRLTAAGEAQLDQLGAVRHVLRLGYFHGCDDQYYVDRYAAEFLAPPGSRSEPGPAVALPLDENTRLPFPQARVLLFQQSRYPEAVILLERHGGLLLTCDCLQHYTDRRFNSMMASIVMPLMGFPLRMLIGPLWLKVMTPEGGSLQPDFERISQLRFRHLISGHGSLCRDDAAEKVDTAIKKVYA